MEQAQKPNVNCMADNLDKEISEEVATCQEPTGLLHIKLQENTSLAPIEKESLYRTFTPFFEQAAKLKEKAMGIVVTCPDQKEETALAKSLRLELRKIRVATEKTKKALTEDARNKTLAINSIAKIITSTITPIEAHLQAQEDVIKEHEAKQKEILRANRTDLLTPFIVDAFVDFEYYRLGEITEAKFQQLLDNFKRRWDEKMEKEKKADQEKKLKDAENAKKLEEKRIENERLKKEKAESDRIAQRKLDKERSEREDEAAKAKIKEQESDQKLAEAQEATQKAEDELAKKRKHEVYKERAIYEQQEKERQEKEDDDAKALMAPDEAKLEALAKQIESITFPDPEVQFNDSKLKLEEVSDRLQECLGILRS